MDNSMKIQEITSAMKQTDNKRLYQKYIVVLNHLNGYSNKDISKMVGVCQHTVGNYIRAYNEQGLHGLNFKEIPGASKWLSDEQELILKDVITTKTPDEVGFPPRKNWTIAIVQQWVANNFGLVYSHSGMAKVMYRLNLSYTTPTYTLAKADSEKL